LFNKDAFELILILEVKKALIDRIREIDSDVALSEIPRAPWCGAKIAWGLKISRGRFLAVV
jgi:hypothetical protein